MTTFLVDVENYGNQWLELYNKREKWEFYLFFTQPSPVLSIKQVQTLTNKAIPPDGCSAFTYLEAIPFLNILPDLELFLCWAGKDAVDFQLSSYLGFLLSSASDDDRFVILSNDKGYDSVCRFWCSKGFSVGRLEIEEPLDLDNWPLSSHASDKFEKCVALIRNYLPSKHKQHSNEIFAVLDRYKNGGRHAVYNSLVQIYGQDNGRSYYKHVRPVIKKIQSILNS